jgi:hypothetical protein
LPFALKAVALFLLVRAVFVALTHMAPSPIESQKPSPIFNSIFYGSDLFFSGHTGLPFLAALALWHIPQWRMFYLALTAFFGSVVLLGHYHYSIDVFAALSSPTASFRPRAGCSVATTRCFVPPRPHNGQSGNFASGSANGSRPTAESGRHWFQSADGCSRLNRLRRTPSAKSRCRPVNRRPSREVPESFGSRGIAFPCPLLALSGHRLVRCTCLLLTQSGHSQS